MSFIFRVPLLTSCLLRCVCVAFPFRSTRGLLGICFPAIGDVIPAELQANIRDRWQPQDAYWVTVTEARRLMFALALLDELVGDDLSDSDDDIAT